MHTAEVISEATKRISQIDAKIERSKLVEELEGEIYDFCQTHISSVNVYIAYIIPIDIGLVVPSADAISESYRRWDMWDDVEDLQLEKAKEQDRIKSLKEKNLETSFGPEIYHD